MGVLGPLVLCCPGPSWAQSLCQASLSAQGDPGGPLACEVEGRWILAGVMSWEKACVKAQNPGVYSRLTRYSKWIKSQMSSGPPSGPGSPVRLLLLLWLLPPQVGP